MKCPVCNQEMYPGIVKSKTNTLFGNRLDNIVFKPEDKYYPAFDIDNINNATAYYCHQCKKIHVMYDILNESLDQSVPFAKRKQYE